MILLTRRDKDGTVAQAGLSQQLPGLVILGTNSGRSAFLSAKDAREFGEHLIELAERAAEMRDPNGDDSD